MVARRTIGLAMILVVVVGVLVVFVGVPMFQTTFHYERQYPTGDTRHVYFDTDVDADVTVTFVDDHTLMYSIDIVQSSPGNHHIFRCNFYDEYISVLIARTESAPPQTINVVLGTGTYYDIIIGGNSNASVTFDNGAVIGGQEVSMNVGGAFFELTEDVSFSDIGMEVSIPADDDVQIIVDLPEGLNGRLDTSGATLGTHTASGWSLVATDTWGTVSILDPVIDIEVGTWGTLTFSLSD